MRTTPIESPRAARSPYESPRTSTRSDPIERSLEPNLAKRAKIALALTATPIPAIALAFLFEELDFPSSTLLILLAATTAVSAAGLISGIATTLGLMRSSAGGRMGLAYAILSIGLGALWAFVSLSQFSRGRQLRRLGRVALAPITDNSAWVAESSSPGIEDVPGGVAAAWRKNGLTEHASVAAFARLSMDLVALGAPPELIKDAHHDALDEMGHTELCFNLARDLDGRADGPAELPAAVAIPLRAGPRSTRLSQLAVESLIDGALNEGVSARVIAELARTATAPRVREVLRAIARDEGRHAAHGFDVVRWCLLEGGLPVAAALRGAIAVLPRRLGKSLSPIASDGRWESWGIPGRDREDRAFEIVREKLIARTERELSRI